MISLLKHKNDIIINAFAKRNCEDSLMGFKKEHQNFIQ